MQIPYGTTRRTAFSLSRSSSTCPYEDTDVIEEQRFTAADGSERTVTMLGSIENDYISGEGCEGFVKYYADFSNCFWVLTAETGLAKGGGVWYNYIST